VHVEVSVRGFAGCFEILGPPTVLVTTPERGFYVALVRAPDPYWGAAEFVGSFDIETVTLSNGDAGEWGVQALLQGRSYDTTPMNVLHATRLSFNAGPEPLRRNHRLTFKGTLRAADWERGSYRGVRGHVSIYAIDGQTTPTWEPLAELRTTRRGHYRVRRVVPGPNRFQAVYLSTDGRAQAVSRIDVVAAPS
jgi:hypothetical protein